MTSWFLKRGYPKRVIKTEMGKSKFRLRLVDREGITQVLLLAPNYHSLLISVCKILNIENVI